MDRVKLFTVVITLVTAGNCFFPQELITAVKEIIDSVRVGQNANEIKGTSKNYDLYCLSL